MANARRPGIVDPMEAPEWVEDGTLCRRASPVPGEVSSAPYAHWSTTDRLVEAARRAGPRLPRHMQEEFALLFSGETLALLVLTLGVWAGSHAIGIGFAADVGLLGLAVFALGTQAVSVAEDLARFVTVGSRARTDAELDEAADHFALAIAVIGVAALVAIVTKVGSRMRGRPARPGNQSQTGGGGSELSPKAGAPLRSPPGGRGNPAPSKRASPVEPKPRVPSRAASTLGDARLRALAAGPGATPEAVQARQSLAKAFYEHHRPGLRADQIESHMRGIDFNKPVRLKTMPPPHRVYQWSGTGGRGSYFSADPRAHPTELGISPKQFDATTGKVVPRQRKEYLLPPGEKIQALESTSASIQDSWSYASRNADGRLQLTKVVNTQGGGGQLFVPDAAKLQPAGRQGGRP